MRYGVRRGGALRGSAAAAVLALAAVGAGGCAMFGGNTSEVCADSRRAVQEYVGRLNQVPANEPAQWKQVTEQLAGRLDTLADTAEDAALRKALKDESARLRTAAKALATGDAAPLNSTLAQTPGRLGGACE
ncbi:hypothetical protein [Thermomonospora cellulosilytica]|uniref:Uncharacterized protein n=1 Tax=Thermomonospora cellulosilytica TaxID=1411118 RepID=A0A7W3MY38_9ACTN|nr:hypothetical protein [Thermomonospora cellulosilytica]MBA9003994.1 hypothetical protein [Thermomonospora cellulosilytica]